LTSHCLDLIPAKVSRLCPCPIANGMIDPSQPSHHLESLWFCPPTVQVFFSARQSTIWAVWLPLKLRPQDIEFSALLKLLEACATSQTSLELDLHSLTRYAKWILFRLYEIFHLTCSFQFKHYTTAPDSNSNDLIPSLLFLTCDTSYTDGDHCPSGNLHFCNTIRLSDRSFSKSPAGIFRTSIPLLNSTGTSLVILRHVDVRTSNFASPLKKTKCVRCSPLRKLQIPLDSGVSPTRQSPIHHRSR